MNAEQIRSQERDRLHDERIAALPALRHSKFNTLRRTITRQAIACADVRVSLAKRTSVADFLVNESYHTFDDFIESERYALVELKADPDDCVFRAMMSFLTGMFIMRPDHMVMTRGVYDLFVKDFGREPCVADDLYENLFKMYGRERAEKVCNFR